MPTRLSQGRSNQADIGSSGSEFLVPREKLTKEALKRIIREMGLKVTEQRLVILETLSRSRAHITAQEIFEKVSKQFPEIGFATVYRFLRDLSDKKLATELRMEGRAARYELTPKSHHDHLTCSECGKIIEFESNDIEALQLLVAKNHGFQLTGHVLELYGICPDCQNA